MGGVVSGGVVTVWWRDRRGWLSLGVLRGRSPACVVPIGLWAVACVLAAYQCRRCSIIAKVLFLSGLSVEFKIVRSKSAVFISSKCFLFFN